MNPSIFFIHCLFTLLSIAFFIGVADFWMPHETLTSSLLIGSISGLLFSGILISLTYLLKGFNIRNLNIAALGLLFGSFFGYVLLHVFTLSERLIPNVFSSDALILIKTIGFLTSCYLGLILTAKAAEELNFCIPFIKFNAAEKKKKDILLDPSLLSDPRMLDLAKSGLLDHQILVPSFALEDFRVSAESNDEVQKNKAQLALETHKKLELLPDFAMRQANHDFPETKDLHSKLTRLARYLNANILTADISKIQQSEMEGLKVINLNLLSQALKPLTSAGEHILIKVQRFGKEPRQGVGYLDDGTMVVVNGGAEFIGKTIKVIVLSIKHTSSGRMIFCNAIDGSTAFEDVPQHVPADLESSHNNFFMS